VRSDEAPAAAFAGTRHPRVVRMIARAHRPAAHVVARGARSHIVRALNLFGRAARRRYHGRTAAARGVFFLRGATWRSRIG
jgi:hypothetical protein